MEENRDADGSRSSATMPTSSGPSPSQSETLISSFADQQLDPNLRSMKDSEISSIHNVVNGRKLDQIPHLLTHASEQLSAEAEEIVSSPAESLVSSPITPVEQLIDDDDCAASANGVDKLESICSQIQMPSPNDPDPLQVQGTSVQNKEAMQTDKGEDVAESSETGEISGTSSDISFGQMTGNSAAPTQNTSEFGAPEDKFTVSTDEPHKFEKMDTRVRREKTDPLGSTKQVNRAVKQDGVHRALIDTTAPFESVKAAVSMFGGIVDWKAHKVQTMERRKYVESELEKAKQEIPQCKKQSEIAESAKAQVLTELSSTKRYVEELKLSLEKAQTEENQAKQDSELARLRVKEIEQGIANEASVAAKAQLEVAQARHKTGVAELKSVKTELEELKVKYASLLNEKDVAVKRAEESVSASKEVEKTLEELTLELIMAKESLESAHTAHLEAEEHRISAAMAKEQDAFNWEREIKEAEAEIQKLNEQHASTKELNTKLVAANEWLTELKAQLAAYMESKLNQETKSAEEEKLSHQFEETKKIKADIQSSIASAKKELDEVSGTIEKAKEDVNYLKVAAVSLKSELEKEKAALVSMRQREGMASIAAASLEAELEKTNQELEMIQMKEKESRDKMVELPKALQQLAQEADVAKSMAKSARDEQRKAKEEAEQAKAGLSTTESRLHAAFKEIEAAKASERLALAAIKALQESESAATPDSPGVTLSLEEYYELSKHTHEAEEQANARVATAISQIEVAKESESRSLQKLEAAIRERDERKEALEIATWKAERAKEGKLGIEQELRKWRAENEQRRKASDAGLRAVNPIRSPKRSFEEPRSSMSFVSELEKASVQSQVLPSEKVFIPESGSMESMKPELKMKKKKSFFPRIVMFLARRKAHSK